MRAIALCQVVILDFQFAAMGHNAKYQIVSLYPSSEFHRHWCVKSELDKIMPQKTNISSRS